MKFHSLMSLALLLPAWASSAVVLAADLQPGGQPLPEPLPLSLLGLGFAVLGWTRRRGNPFGRLKQDLERHLFPWPALSWLD